MRVCYLIPAPARTISDFSVELQEDLSLKEQL